jgi:hypothetical protein
MHAARHISEGHSKAAISAGEGRLGVSGACECTFCKYILQGEVPFLSAPAAKVSALK